MLAHFVPSLMTKLSQQQLTLETKQSEDLAMLTKHEVDLALVTSLQGTHPQDRQVEYQALQEINFVTVASHTHPMLIEHGAHLSIDQVLEYPFVIPSKPIYGKMATNRSLDGWFDEEFNRRIMARVDTTSMLTSLVKSQPLLAYVPDYLAKEHSLQILEVSGCPYTCEQTVWLCRNKHLSAHWMQAFE
ncbi:hypothetical protein JCM19236_4042 [Vibrio sp. JCM 19236]|nr:hypothetical protein JCM19236_4042 [Vibrio sp. JCM 19236]